MIESFLKNSKITVCFFGKKIEEIYSDKNAPDYEEKSFNVLNYENDNDLNNIIKKYDPNVFVTFDDWHKYNFLCNAHHDIRRKWINCFSSISNENLGKEILECYINCTLNYKEFSNNSPLISIFTPTYKTGSKIFRPLQSLLNQTYKNWEWIILDDSNDNDQTFNLLKEISEMDNRIKVFKNARSSGSIGELKRWAAGLCSGEYLCELDHDDELTKKCLEYVVKTFQKYQDVGFVYTDSAEVFEEDGSNVKYCDGFCFGYGSYRQESYNGKTYEVSNGPRINPKTIRHIIGVPNHARVWKRDNYFKINGHNPNLHVCDDYELIIKTFLTTKIAHIPKFGYIQYRNKEGNTFLSRNKEIQRLVRLIKDSYDFLIHEKFKELNINDFVYDESTQTSNLDKQNLEYEQHICIISDVN